MKNKKLNRFEIHINHSKQKVLGQKSKDDHGLPGISRGKAFRKREKTLLPEYRDRYKDSKFLDLRIGEKNKFLDPEKRILLRIAAEKKRQFSKKSIFNLNDDEQLTHGGKSLTDVIMKDQTIFSDEDEDNDMLDASFVKERHFGGGIFTKVDEEANNNNRGDKNVGTKSRKEWIEEMIAESKQKKAENKREKEIQHDAVSKLDAKFQTFLSLMKDKIMTDDDKERSKKTCDYRDYDMAVRELAFDRSKRAKPTDRLKTNEEIAKEEMERLRKLEEDRQKRMRGETDDNRHNVGVSADALDDGYGVGIMNFSQPENFLKAPKTAQVDTEKRTKGTDIMKKETYKKKFETSKEEEGSEEEDENKQVDSNTISQQGKEQESGEEESEPEISEEEENDSSEHDSSEQENKVEKDDDEQGSEDEGDHSEEEETEKVSDEGFEKNEELEESEEEDDKPFTCEEDLNDLKEEEEQSISGAESDDLVPKDGKEKEVRKEAKVKHQLPKVEISKKPLSKQEIAEEDSLPVGKQKSEEMSEEAKEELPFTFEVPVEYDAFWDLLQKKTPSQISTIVERMISCNHPSLGADNDVKSSTIFAYLLQTLHIICGHDPEILREDIHPMEYINILVPHLYTLTQLSPPNSARSLIQVIDEKYEDYTGQKSRLYPYADTFIFLKISGLLFPASDFHHDVMTRVTTFLIQLLGEAKVTSGRDVVALLFTSSLLFEYLNRSSRFVGELMNALNGIVYLSIATDDLKLSLPVTPPFKRIGPSSDFLALNKPHRKPICFKLKFSLLNEDITINNNFKVGILNESLKLMNKLCNKWVNSPAVRAIFHPTTKLLQRIVRKNYPEETNTLIDTLQTSIAQLPKQLPRLRREETQVKVLRMLTPATEEIVEGVKKRVGSREFQERQKLLHKLKRERKGARRELKRDAQFIARQQLTETLASDAERKRKVNLIMQGLATQESEYQKFKKIKSKK